MNIHARSCSSYVAAAAVGSKKIIAKRSSSRCFAFASLLISSIALGPIGCLGPEHTDQSESLSTVWQNLPFTAQSAAFTAEFDAVPSANNEDVVIGLGSGAASAYTNLAAIVRFSPAGIIDVRNGGTYTSVVSTPYAAGQSFHFKMNVNLAAKTYSVYVTPQGQAQVLLASNYAFRTEQSSVATLNNRAIGSAVGSVTIANFSVFTPPTPTGVWSNSTYASQTGTFTVNFDSVPSASGTGEDSVIGLSNGSASAYTNLAAIVRFANESGGNIDVRNGGVYTYDVAVPYSAGATYRIRMDVNIPSHTYSVYVTPPSGTAVRIANNYAFRSEQATVAALSNIANYSAFGGISVGNFALSNSVPAPSPTGGLITNFTSVPTKAFQIDGVPVGVNTAGKSYSLNEIDDHTLRFEIQQGDRRTSDSAGVDRSEIDRGDVNYLWAAAKPVTIEYQFMLEPGATNTASWFCTSQIHNWDPDLFNGSWSPGTSPPVSIGLGGPSSNVWGGGDYLNARIIYCTAGSNCNNGAGAANLTTNFLYVTPTPIVRGQWYDIRIETNISITGGGYLRVWINGSQVVNYSGLLGYGSRTYWENGLYRASVNQDTAAQFRNLTITP